MAFRSLPNFFVDGPLRVDLGIRRGNGLQIHWLGVRLSLEGKSLNEKRVNDCTRLEPYKLTL